MVEYNQKNYQVIFNVDCMTDFSRNQVAFWVASPRTQRSFCFAILEVLTGEDRPSGYGFVIPYYPESNEFVFPEITRGFNPFETIESSKQFVINTIEILNKRG